MLRKVCFFETSLCLTAFLLLASLCSRGLRHSRLVVESHLVGACIAYLDGIHFIRIWLRLNYLVESVNIILRSSIRAICDRSYIFSPPATHVERRHRLGRDDCRFVQCAIGCNRSECWQAARWSKGLASVGASDRQLPVCGVGTGLCAYACRMVAGGLPNKVSECNNL